MIVLINNKYTVNFISGKILSMIFYKFDINYDIKSNIVYEKSKKYQEYSKYLIETCNRIKKFYIMIDNKNIISLIEEIVRYILRNLGNNENESTNHFV